MKSKSGVASTAFQDFDQPSDIEFAIAFSSIKPPQNASKKSTPTTSPASTSFQLKDFLQDSQEQIQISLPPEEYTKWQRVSQEAMNYPLGGVFLLTGVLSALISPYTEIVSPYSEIYKISVPAFVYTWRQILRACANDKHPLDGLKAIGGGNLTIGLCRKSSSVLAASSLVMLVGYGLGTFMMYYAPGLETIKAALDFFVGAGWAEGNSFSILFLGTVGYVGFRLGEAGFMKIWEQFISSKAKLTQQSITLAQKFLQYILRFCDTVGTTEALLLLLPFNMVKNYHWQNGLLVISDTFLRLGNHLSFKKNPFTSTKIRFYDDIPDSQCNSHELAIPVKRATQFWSTIQLTEIFLIYLLAGITCQYLDKDKCAEDSVMERLTRTLGIYGGVLLCEFILGNIKKLSEISIPSLSKCYSVLFNFRKTPKTQPLLINDTETQSTPSYSSFDKK